jgi:ribosomal protein S15P/S13E
MVARRRKLLDYLSRTDHERYQKVLTTLGLRR